MTTKNDLAPDPQRWIDAYGDYLFSIAMLKTGNREIAEDLVQDTFLAAIRNLANFEGRSSEKTWLTAILKNKIIDHYRKKQIFKESDRYLSETEGQFYQNFFEPEGQHTGHWLKNSAPVSWAPSADTNLHSKEFQQILDACIHKMPSKLVPVFIARYMEDQDSEIICKELGISSSNYWVMLHRAKILIRECLEIKWFRN